MQGYLSYHSIFFYKFEIFYNKKVKEIVTPSWNWTTVPCQQLDDS